VIVLQTLDPHQTVVCDAATGQQRASIPGDDCPWLSAPLYCAPDLLALVTADRRIRGLSLNPPRYVWTYQGQMSFANVDPILRTNGSQLLLVVDGDTLVKLSPETGQTVWTSGLGRSAVANPEHSIVLDGDNVYAASSGILRCFDLANGRLRWEQWLGSADREWTVSRSGDFVAAIPRREPAALGPADALVFCEAKNGRFVQKLALQQPAIHLHLKPGSAALLTVGNETYGLAR
jgi:hypothetical protein